MATQQCQRLRLRPRQRAEGNGCNEGDGIFDDSGNSGGTSNGNSDGCCGKGSSIGDNVSEAIKAMTAEMRALEAATAVVRVTAMATKEFVAVAVVAAAAAAECWLCSRSFCPNQRYSMTEEHADFDLRKVTI